MANSLDRLIPDLYEAVDVVSREITGFIPAVTLNASGERAAVGQEILIHQAPESVASPIVPSMTHGEPADQTIGHTSLKITNSESVQFAWTGKEQRGLNHGSGYRNIQVDQIAQAIRTLVNKVEKSCADQFVSTSRAYGVAGTTPFATNLQDTAQVGKILTDNGASPDRHMILGTTAGAAMRTLPNLYKANEAGETSLLRQGLLTDLHGFGIRESAQVGMHTAGTITANVTVTGATALGATTINVTTDATGAVALLAGDVITFAGSAHKYVVAVAVTIGNSTTGDIVINPNGLQAALAGSEVVAAGASYVANMAFSRNAIQLITRAPELPEEGDSAVDRQTIVDPRTGLSFEVSMYAGVRKVAYDVSLAWGSANIKPEHSVLVLG